MNTNKKPVCWIGVHSDEIHQEVPLTDLKNNNIGVVIINRCTSCGRIKDKKIRTVEVL